MIFVVILALIFLLGCLMPGEMLYTQDGTLRVRQPKNANTPATIKIFGHVFSTALTNAPSLKVSTGAVEPETPAQVREESRSKLIWIGSALIAVGIAVAFLFKWPTPGACTGGAGIALLGFHQYPWITLVVAGLLSAALAIYLGYTVAERTFSQPPQQK